ncbi:ABC-2 transporter permease [Candidatus Enterococcus murrayae]|uniref:ABC-2 transporter permease n=1 Tax=Candidatus Enterococcus murrayae TaxID=2815321 RepID=A0ABS3HG14_9ENTE|nr:ABC-2 transporter permease [Enterococcus sp. MJM16]MBO0452395.1 ABC-2 transporter permease [Enterococcus sp. MJM16]
MKGLYIKDLRLLAKQKLFFLAIIFLTVMNAYNLESLSIVPSLMLFFFVTLIFTTVTYDEMNHGLTFLFTLPISRKKYIVQKYSLAIIGSIVALLLSIAIVFIMTGIQGKSVNLEAFSIILFSLFIAGLFYISLMMPIYFKFGEEKSRMIMILVMGVIFFFAFLGRSLVERLSIDIDMILQRITNAPLWLMLAAGTTAAGILCILSYFLSFRILGKKEF